MKEKIDGAIIRGQIELHNTVDRLASEERGASDIVAVVVLIVIAIAAGVIFKKQLEKAVQNVFSNLDSFVSKSAN